MAAPHSAPAAAWISPFSAPWKFAKPNSTPNTLPSGFVHVNGMGPPSGSVCTTAKSSSVEAAFLRFTVTPIAAQYGWMASRSRWLPWLMVKSNEKPSGYPASASSSFAASGS